MSNNGLKVGDTVKFNYDLDSEGVKTGDCGIVVRQRLNTVGWHIDVIELSDGTTIELNWANIEAVSRVRQKPKPKYHQRRVGFSFKLYDLWVGAYVDTENRTVYVCPLPCCVIEVHY